MIFYNRVSYERAVTVRGKPGNAEKTVLHMLCLRIQLRGGCDLGGVWDGSRLAIYETLSSECPSSCYTLSRVHNASILWLCVPAETLRPKFPFLLFFV